MKHFVYVLVDPRNQTPFYVGKGTNNRHRLHVLAVKRKYQHRSFHVNPCKDQRISEILQQGFDDVLYQLTYFETDIEAFAHEKQVIDQIGLLNLTNITSGGDQGPYQGKAVDQYNIYGEFIATYPSALEAAFQMGKPNLSTTISRACRNNVKSKRPLGYIWAYADVKPNFSHIWKTVCPIYQYTLQGQLVNRFPSAIEAARQCLGNSRRSGEIRQAAKKDWVCKGYLWKFPTSPAEL